MHQLTDLFQSLAEAYLVSLGLKAHPYMSHKHLLSVGFWILCACSLANGDDRRLPITPKQWQPDVTGAIEWLEQDLQETQAQQGMNRLSRRIADLKDAQLFAVYIRVAEFLERRRSAEIA